MGWQRKTNITVPTYVFVRADKPLDNWTPTVEGEFVILFLYRFVPSLPRIRRITSTCGFALCKRNKCVSWEGTMVQAAQRVTYCAR